jgi:hypothetical protein
MSFSDVESRGGSLRFRIVGNVYAIVTEHWSLAPRSNAGSESRE